MFRKDNRRQIWFGAFVAGGVVLGLILLAQTVSTYVYVSGNLVTQEGLRDAERYMASAQRMIRRAEATDAVRLTSVLTDLREESAGHIVWMRLVEPGGSVVASSGMPTGEPLSFSSLRETMRDRGVFYETRETPDGPVLVTVSPIRLDAPEAGIPGSDLALLEVAVDLDQLAAGFVYLRANLVIGVSAALALLGTLLLIRLRFPHYLRGKQLEVQVELARTVQADLLPKSKLISRDAEIAADCQPAGHVGGDFYDVFETDNGQLALMLGDVCGKGIAAAPLMGFIQGAAEASPWTESSYDHETASRRLNALLYKKTAAERFISMFWAYFDRDGSKLNYVNAGHLPALRMRMGASGIEATRLCEGGPVLGVVPGAGYSQGQVDIDPGDVLVVFSDGIVETENGSEREFGESGILQAVADEWYGSVEDIRSRIMDNVRQFSGNRPADDDRTLIVLRFSANSPLQYEEESIAVYA